MLFLHLRNIPHHWPEDLKTTLFDIGSNLQTGECSNDALIDAMRALNGYLNSDKCTDADAEIIDRLTGMFIQLREARERVLYASMPDGTVSGALSGGLSIDDLVNDLCKQSNSTPEIVGSLILYQLLDPHLLTGLLSSTSYHVFKRAIQSNLNQLFYHDKCEILRAVMKHHRDDILDEMLPGWEMHTPKDLKEGPALIDGLTRWCKSLSLDEDYAEVIVNGYVELRTYAVNEVRDTAPAKDFIQLVSLDEQQKNEKSNTSATKKTVRFYQNVCEEPVMHKKTYECDLSTTTRYPKFKSTRRLIDLPSPS